MKNNWKHKFIALLSVGLLSIPSAIGVQQALEPTRGMIASWLAAAGFEAVYLGTALLILGGDLRVYAQRVAAAAVTTAVMLNVIADYRMRVPGGLDNGTTFVASFDWLSLGLSIVESLPLAGLAYAMARLLHAIAEDEHRQYWHEYQLREDITYEVLENVTNEMMDDARDLRQRVTWLEKAITTGRANGHTDEPLRNTERIA